jgi:hypothetical protein
MTGSTEVTFCGKHGNECAATREPFDFTLTQEQKHEVFDLARVNVVRATSYQRLDFRVDRVLNVRGGQLDLYSGFHRIPFGPENLSVYRWSSSTCGD